MSIRLRELIRAVRACKTAAEERDVIAKESAALREAFREQDVRYRHRNVAKLMYIHMLGYPTHFGQMETLKLIASNGFPEKRIGYLGLMILLDERQEVLMLVTNSIKMDLNHKNQYIVGLALAALGNICSAEMARDLAPDVERLLENPNPYIRKKAAVCATRVVRKVPELIESFEDKAAELVHDKNHAVMLCGVTLMLQICALNPDSISRYRTYVPILCKVLKSLLQSGFSPEHDVGGISDPFLQVKILRLLRVLGKGNADASDLMSDILAQVATNVDSNRNAGNAILYEAVQTIMGIETIGGLRVMAINILGKFLANKDNNIRYVALNTLSRIVAADTAAVQRHRNTIVDCVKDADVSIRRRALELVYSLVNENNIKTLTRELLDYLVVCDSEFKPDLTAKVCTLIQRFAPDKRWHIDNLVQVMIQAGAYVKEEVCRALIVLITNATELHGYAVRTMYRTLKEHAVTAEQSLVVTSLWCIGELGELLLPKAGGPLLEGEEELNITDSNVVDLLEAEIKRAKNNSVVKEYALTCAMKLSARLPGQVSRIKALLQKHSISTLLEVQQRSCEYLKIFAHENIRPSLLERMPALDESDYTRNMTGEVKTSLAQTAPSSGITEGATTAPPKTDDLVDLLGGLDAVSATLGPSPAVNALDDLLAPSSAGGAANGGGDIMDLLGGGPPPAANTVDPLGGLLGAAPQATPYQPLTAFEKAGVKVVFHFSKPSGPQGQATHITARYFNTNTEAISNFTVQAAVPKYIQLKLEPPTATTLPPLGAGNVSQMVHLHNTMQGEKPLALRLRVTYNMGDQQVLEQCEVSNFPPGL